MKNDTEFLISLVERTRQAANQAFDEIIEHFENARCIRNNTTYKSRNKIKEIKAAIYSTRHDFRIACEFMNSVLTSFYQFYSIRREKGDKIRDEIRVAEDKMWERINKQSN